MIGISTFKQLFNKIKFDKGLNQYVVEDRNGTILFMGSKPLCKAYLTTHKNLL